MLAPEQAKERLAAARDDGRVEARRRAVGRLPPPQRALGEALLAPGHLAGDAALRAREAATAFDRAQEEDRRELFDALFPALGPHLERAWQLGKAQPYQHNRSRRAFRAPGEPSVTLAARLGRLRSQTAALAAYDPDPVWVARWAPYLHWADPFGLLLAAVVDGGGADGAAVFDVLVASANGDDEVGQMGRHVTTALLAAGREDGWELVERLLVAAQRQEGLRQVILETADLAHPDAFRRMLALVVEQGLTRFSSAVRALDVWFGFQFAAGDARGMAALLERTLGYLADEGARDAAIRAGGGEDAYLGLWALAYEDAVRARPAAETLLADPDPGRRYAAAHLLGELNLRSAARALVAGLADEDERVVLRSLQALSWQTPGEGRAERAPLVDELERLVERLGPRKRELEPILWPWTGGTLDRADVAAQLLRHGAAEPLERFVPQLPRMNAGTRLAFARRLAEETPRAELRAVALELLGDASAGVREQAIRAAAKAPVTDAEAPPLEDLLRRKREDLRRGAVALLLNRNDDGVLASAGRLLAGDAQQRLGGLELLRRLAEEERSAGNARARAAEFAAAGEPAEAERRQLDAILSDRAEEIAALDRRLGMVDERRLTPPLRPERRKVALMTEPAAALLRDLDELVHEHREDRVAFTPAFGAEREELLGNLRHFPRPWTRRGQRDNRPEEAALPLAELWLGWNDARGPGTRDADGFELARAAGVLILAGWPGQAELVADALKTIAGKLKVPQLRYAGTVRAVLDWLLVLRPPDDLGGFLLDADETLLASVPDRDLQAPPAKELWRRVTWRVRGWRAYHDLLMMHLQFAPRALDDAQWLRAWRLGLWVQDPHPGRGSAERQALAFVTAAHERGVASDDDVLDYLLDPPATEPWNRGHHELYALSGRRVAVQPELLALVDRIRRRVVEVELQRGEAPTPASSTARALRWSGGLDTLAAVVARLGKEGFIRGWTYDSASAKSVFSHLVRTSFPADADTVEAFAAAMKAARVSDRRLVELAAFAPQWARHAEHATGREGLASAVWWLHAHTKDAGWTVDREIREAWAAEVAERTPLTSEELLRGAVDVDWFSRVHEQAGPERWAALDAAAKYCSTGAGHKRAQLFADAMLGRVTEQELAARITGKRNQDAVRALGLVPLPAGGGRDEAVLARFGVMQEFLRTSRQFGSQRRTSEKLAVEIGMANLARTAGFRDPIRLSWAMEARGVADLADGPLREELDGVELTLTLEDGVPALAACRAGKELKDVPAKLRGRKEVKALRARVTELRRQGSRVRDSLEDAMIRGDRFSGEELSELASHLVLYPRLDRLVLLGDGTAGYPGAGGRVLRDHAGRDHAIGRDEELRIAHPLDLLELGDWHEWQRDCLGRRVVQPFKQVFRELYVPTAEERGAYLSRRYAGNQLQPRQALALLGARGWVAHPEEGVRKTFHREGVTASVWFLEAFFTPADVEGLTIEEVRFAAPERAEAPTLGELPGRLFSEVMRDLDLMVSVAHAGGVDPETSSSTVGMRAALVKETAELLEIGNVRVEEPWVLVDGTLGDWSVHLGSANVHRRPGGAVCIVPVHGQHRGRIFLPFADDDPKTAEVMAKVLLLANDSEIRDPTILEQLRA